MLIADPGVNGISFCSSLVLRNRLAKGEVRGSGVSSELNKNSGFGFFNNPIGKRDMPEPSAWLPKINGAKVD
jgi:hypothetical protein